MTERALVGLPLAAAATVVALAGCGGSEQEPPTFAAGQVQRMIVRSITPTIERNLGEGSTVKAACVPGDGYAYRCTATLLPGGETAGAIRVVYRVECDERTCRWNPIG